MSKETETMQSLRNITQISETLEEISPADQEAMHAAMQRQDSLAKPPGSLGGLEEIAVRMAGIRGQVAGIRGQDTGIREAEDARGLRSCVIVFSADNGVAAQGVSSAPQSVTRAQTINFTRRLTGVGTLSKSFGSDLLIVDMGVKDPIPEELYDEIPLRDTTKIIDRRIRPGTWDIAEGPAMTEQEALQAIASGIEMARDAADAGIEILGVGEMGIGNTTTSAAVLSCITGEPAERTCSRGGGVNDTGFLRKKEIVDGIRAEWLQEQAGSGVETACAEAAGSESQAGEEPAGAQQEPAGAQQESATVQQEPADARLSRIVRILSRCGGFDIAAMAGAFLGAAATHTPVVIDGYISAVAALAAAEISPAAADYMFASHKSVEQGYALALRRLAEYSPGLKPFLALDMRLGEGSGCPIAFEIIRAACDVMQNMATFEEAEINDDYLEEVRAGGCF